MLWIIHRLLMRLCVRVPSMQKQAYWPNKIRTEPEMEWKTSDSPFRLSGNDRAENYFYCTFIFGS